jgi:hypothetical protein
MEKARSNHLLAFKLQGNNKSMASGPDNISQQNTKRSSKFYSPNLNYYFSKITSDWLHTI